MARNLVHVLQQRDPTGEWRPVMNADALRGPDTARKFATKRGVPGAYRTLVVEDEFVLEKKVVQTELMQVVETAEVAFGPGDHQPPLPGVTGDTSA